MASFPTVDFSQYKWEENDQNYLFKWNNFQTAINILQENINKFGVEVKAEVDSAIGIAQSLIEAYNVNVLAPYKDKATLLSDFANQRFRLYDGLRINDIADTSLWTIERSTIGTYVDATGKIRTAAIDEPRYAYNPETGESLGLLSETNTTNELLYSEDFENPWWEKSNGTIGSLSIDSPVSVAKKFIAGAGENWNRLFKFLPVESGETYTVSWLVKAGDIGFCSTYFRSAEFGASNNANTLVVDLSTGNYSAGSGLINCEVEKYPDGWFFISATCTCQNTATSQVVLSLADSIDITNAPVVNGDGVSGIYVAAAQFEVGQFRSSYIYTNGSSVTRLQDSIYKNIASEISSNINFYYIEWECNTNLTTNFNGIFGVGNSNANFFDKLSISHGQSGRIDVLYYNGGTDLLRTPDGSAAFNKPNKLAITFNTNSGEIRVFLNGVYEGSMLTTNLPDFTTWDALWLGGLNNIDENKASQVKIKDFFVLSYAPSDAELIATTAGGQS